MEKIHVHDLSHSLELWIQLFRRSIMHRFALCFALLTLALSASTC